MAHDTLNASTARLFRDNQVRYTKRHAKSSVFTGAGKRNVRPPSDGPPKEVHRREVQRGATARPQHTPALTADNARQVGTGHTMRQKVQVFRDTNDVSQGNDVSGRREYPRRLVITVTGRAQWLGLPRRGED